MDKTASVGAGLSRLTPLYRNISLCLLHATLIIRIYLPGLTVGPGENSLLWLLAWVSLLFCYIHASESPRCYLGAPVLSGGIALVALLPFASILWAGDRMQAFYRSMTWLADIVVFLVVCYWGREQRWRRQIIAVVLACAVMEIGYVIYQYFIGMPATRALVQQNPELVTQLQTSPDFTTVFYARLYSPYIFGHFTLTNLLGEIGRAHV